MGPSPIPTTKMPFEKYVPFERFVLPDRTWPDKVITSAPIWCSVDLRDGNQALINPMDGERKRRMWDLLCKVGFKEIEVGFPAASQTDYDFVRSLIEGDKIPHDVTIQVLTQSRPELIEKTFEAIAGCRRAIVHLYNSTSALQRRVVFGLDRPGIIDIAVRGAELCRKMAASVPDTEIVWEYSPESFTGTEMPFAQEICEAVMDVYEPDDDNKIILNLPATVEMSTPNIYGDQIEWFLRNVKNRSSVLLSLHPHNDRGTAVAAAEFGFMAGADRIEGCLFGNGERTGNVDVVTLALNMFTQGVDPRLDLSELDEMKRVVEHCNQLPIHPRHPYVGDLVYTAFSGSHQDAIKKGFAALTEGDGAADGSYSQWEVPYLPIDPLHVGRNYEAVVRVNSQSGKGGVSFVLLHEYHLDLPRGMQVQFTNEIQRITDETSVEITSYEIFREFEKNYLRSDTPLELVSHRYSTDTTEADKTELTAKVRWAGEERTVSGVGNGPIDAFLAALRADLGIEVTLLSYVEHAVERGSDAQAAAYIELETADQINYWGCGMDANIVTASLRALVSALNVASASASSLVG
ncbi:MAG: 2-isopropylmalate synthase [Acidimicrobiia bacterium]|nr:2-isopropylmalate synthase [Acidimicrobiia bacterium]